MLLCIYAITALMSTTIATPTPSYELKQVSRAEASRRPIDTDSATSRPVLTQSQVIRRIKRGVRPRAPIPSGAGGAPEFVHPTADDGATFNRYYSGSGFLLSDNPSGRSAARCYFRCTANEKIRISGELAEAPSEYTTYDRTVSTANAAQQCVDFAIGQGGGTYYGAALWFDESDDLWHCRVTYSQNRASDFTAEDTNARPVYGYNLD